MNIKQIFFIFLFSFSLMMPAQNIQISKISEAHGGEYQFNQSKQSCVTALLRQKIDSVVASATEKFETVHGKQPMTTFFDWPVQKAANSPYFEAWAISNYVDHNTGFPNQVTDYNCGPRSYDTSNGYNHQGIDIYTWPFSWDQFYNNQAEVIAAAPGTIVFKDDGNFDRSCAFNNNDWNAIYVQHNDGSLALYGHMKKNTLTTKGVGDNVQAGEFLGVIGSSGNSTGPHLHFEVFDSAGNLIDPYSGPCNSLNANSWWNTQKNYWEPNINAILTQGSPPNFKSCPQPAVFNPQNTFDFGETIYLASYFRDQIAGTQVNYALKTEGGATISTWSKVFQNTYSSSYWWYSVSFSNGPTNILDLVFEVSYNGQTKSIFFQVGNGLGSKDVAAQNFSVYPNPFKENINLTGETPMESISIYDVKGKLVLTENIDKTSVLISTAKLSSGVYFLRITDREGKTNVKKMVKR